MQIPAALGWGAESHLVKAVWCIEKPDNVPLHWQWKEKKQQVALNTQMKHGSTTEEYISDTLLKMVENWKISKLCSACALRQWNKCGRRNQTLWTSRTSAAQQSRGEWCLWSKSTVTHIIASDYVAFWLQSSMCCKDHWSKSVLLSSFLVNIEDLHVLLLTSVHFAKNSYPSTIHQHPAVKCSFRMKGL